MIGEICGCLAHARELHLQAWIQTMLLTANLFPLTCFGIAAVLNTIAIGCGRSHCRAMRCSNSAAVLSARPLYSLHFHTDAWSASVGVKAGVTACHSSTHIRE